MHMLEETIILFFLKTDAFHTLMSAKQNMTCIGSFDLVADKRRKRVRLCFCIALHESTTINYKNTLTSINFFYRKNCSKL